MRMAFNWTEYLIKTNTRAAPTACFCQNTAPVKNEFVIGQKLEAVDPRNESSICVATVISTYGTRLRLRLDGSDDRNDFWRLCDDSRRLFPYESSAKRGINIQPPIGFLLDLSKWDKFLDKMIKSAGDGQIVFAPENAFKESPQSPPCNMFKVGQKLEAVDPKDPLFIYPATIRQVKGDRILVGFDGFDRQGEFWCHYASRDIFPVGWCQSTGHYLHGPGNLVEKKPLVKEVNCLNAPIKRKLSEFENNSSNACIAQKKIKKEPKLKSNKNKFEKKQITSSTLIDSNTSSTETPQKIQVIEIEKPSSNIHLKSKETENIEKQCVGEWSVQNVVNYLKTIDRKDFLSPYINSFEQQKIDGESLLSLNLDILVKHMNFKVGPALQLVEHISKLRKGLISPDNINSSTTISNKVRKQSHLICQMKEIEDMQFKKEENSSFKQEFVMRWSKEEVSKYIENVGKKRFSHFAIKFKEQNIDGEALLSLNIKDLTKNFQMSSKRAEELNDHLEILRCSILKKIHQ